MGNDAASERRESRGVWREIAVVVFVSLGVRVFYLIETADVIFVRQPVGDAVGYFAWARQIAAGEWVGTEPFYQAPAYPYFLAILFRLVGDGVQTARLAQCVGAAIAAGMLTAVATWLFDRRVGLVAGLMLAFYAPAIFFDGLLQKASLGCLLTCLLMLLVTFLLRKMCVWSVMGFGVCGALLSLTRENAIVWIAVLFAWLMVWRSRGVNASRVATAWGPGLLRGTGGGGRRLTESREEPSRDGRVGFCQWRVVGPYVVGVAVVLFPVAVRNAAVGGGWSVSTFQAGTNFYIGNHVGATGRYVPLVRGHETPAFERTDATELAERAEGRQLRAPEVSRFWFCRAFDDIRARPGRWLGLMAKKFVMVFNDYEVADAESAIVYADTSCVLRAIGYVWRFGVLCPLALLGLVLTRRRWVELWVFYALIGSMVCAVAAFYVMARYRYPIVPLLIPFAAVGLVESVRRLRAGTGWTLRWGGIAAFAACVLCWWPILDRGRLDAMAWMNAGVAHAQIGELDSATRYFRFAVSENPESAEAPNNLGQALAIGGDFAGAALNYEAALSIEPGLIGANYNLGVALEQLGRVDEALAQYRLAVEVDSSDAEARAAIVRIKSSE